MNEVPADWFPYETTTQPRHWNPEAGRAPKPSAPHASPSLGQGRSTSRALGRLLTPLGAAFLIAAVFTPWFDNGSSLASHANQLAYNLPSMALAVIAGSLALFRSRQSTAAPLTILVAIWLAIGLITEFGGHWDYGQWLSAEAAVILTAAGVSCLRATRLSVKVDLPAVGWAAGSCLLAALWIVGEWLPWSRFSWTPAGAPQGAEMHSECCVPFQNRAVADNIREAATMCLILGGAVILSLLWRRTASGAALTALGAMFLSQSAKWLVDLATPNVTERLRSEGVNLRVTVTESGLPGGWIATGAATALVLLGLMRLLASLAKPRTHIQPGLHPGHRPAEQGHDETFEDVTSEVSDSQTDGSDPAGVAFTPRSKATEGVEASGSTYRSHPRPASWWLPKAPAKQYMPDGLPSTDVVLMCNFEWLERELAARTCNDALEQASMILRGHPNENQINAMVHRFATHVQGALGSAGAGQAIFEELFYCVWLGVGFGYLEQASGRQLPGLVHPSIWNGVVMAGSGRNQQLPPELNRTFDKAREGGYAATRHRLPPEQIFRACAFGR